MSSQSLQSSIVTILAPSLHPDLHPALSKLATTLKSVVDGELSPTVAARGLSSDIIVATTVLRLAGARLSALGTTVVFGDGEQLGKILIGAEPEAALFRPLISLNVLSYYFPGAYQTDKHRLSILRNAQMLWAELLKHHLAGHPELTPDLVSHPLAINPLPEPLGERSQLPAQIPGHTPILALLAASSGSLLILGGPGAGKTTMLLRLYSALLSVAAGDANHPLPLFFSLASWSTRQGPLDAWLVDELVRQYDVPRTIAALWLADTRVMPLLDDLDEVAPLAQSACVIAINAYRRTHPHVPLVVCARTEHYDKLETKLMLQSSVILQPLTTTQIEHALERCKWQDDGLQAHLKRQAELSDWLRSPLMLEMSWRVAEAATAEVSVKAHTATPSALLTAYIRLALEHISAQTGYNRVKALSVLRRLAQFMLEQGETALTLDRLQPVLLPTRRWRLRYLLLDRVGWGGFFAALFSIPVWLTDSWGTALLIGIPAGLIAGLFGPTTAQISYVRPRVWPSARSALVNYAALGGGVAINSTLLTLARGEIPFTLAYGMLAILLLGPIGAMIGLLGSPSGIGPRLVATFEPLRLSLTNARMATRRGLAAGAAIGLVELFLGTTGLLILIIVIEERTDELLTRLGSVLPLQILLMAVGGVAFSLFYGGICMVVGGLSGGAVEADLRPGANVRRSLRSSLLVGLPLALLLNALIALPLYLAEAYQVAAVLAAYIALSCLLAMGGYTLLSYAALRIVLWWSSLLPLRASRLLRAAASAGLLCYGGDRYRFRYRLLMEYMARLDDETIANLAAHQHTPPSTGQS